jgi:hypothetical protein
MTTEDVKTLLSVTPAAKVGAPPGVDPAAGVQVDVGDRDVVDPGQPGDQRELRREAAEAVAQQDADGAVAGSRTVVAHEDVAVAAAVDVGHHHGHRRVAHGELGRGAEGWRAHRSARVQQDADVVGPEVGGDDVQHGVAVEVAQSDIAGPGAVGQGQDQAWVEEAAAVDALEDPHLVERRLQ